MGKTNGHQPNSGNVLEEVLAIRRWSDMNPLHSIDSPNLREASCRTPERKAFRLFRTDEEGNNLPSSGGSALAVRKVRKGIPVLVLGQELGRLNDNL